MARIAIVTGGASGIGAALGAALAAGGDTVVLADVDVLGAEVVAEQIVGDGGQATAAKLDVRDAEAVRELVDRTVAERGRIDLMVNNAGIGMGGDSAELSLEHWDRSIDVNLRGVVHGVHAALPHMIRQGDGHIVNTGSLAGLFPSPFLAPYIATKHAVVGMTLALRVEYAGRNIRFTVLCPGFTDTPILDKGMPEDLPQLESAPAVRELAASLPGGIYDLDKLVKDICDGIDKNEAMVVAPASARAAWRSWRTSPGMVLKVLSRQAQAGVEAARKARGDRAP